MITLNLMKNKKKELEKLNQEIKNCKSVLCEN